MAKKLTQEERKDLWLALRENFPEKEQTELDTMYKRLLNVGKKLYIHVVNGHVCRVGVITGGKWNRTYYRTSFGEKHKL